MANEDRNDPGEQKPDLEPRSSLRTEDPEEQSGADEK